MELGGLLKSVKSKVRGSFLKDSEFSKKRELNISSLKWVLVSSLIVFVGVVLFLPNEVPVQFSQKIDASSDDPRTVERGEAKQQESANQLWASPKSQSYRTAGGGGGGQVNYNTAMVVGGSANAKTQLYAGFRLPLRILDRVVVSQESVPVLAELILDSETESGLRLKAGTRFYGDATFTKGSERATVVFRQISLANGQFKKINAKAIGKDGQLGLSGKVYSDGNKNTAGHVLTAFVGGLAAGSVQTDVFGRSQGGIGNGLLTAVADTARAKAQNYGEKLKAEREWIEIPSNSECDAQLAESMSLQYGASNE